MEEAQKVRLLSEIWTVNTKLVTFHMGPNPPTESWARGHASSVVQIICLYFVYVLRLRVVWMD